MFDLVERLVRTPNRWFAYSQLRREVWEDEYLGDSAIKTAVSRLKSKLAGSGMAELAQTICTIAATLHVDVAAIRRKRDLLVGVCPEAVVLLKDKRVSPAALREVKRVSAMRQIEMAELMAAANNYSSSYAKCLYAMTPEGQRLADDKPNEDEHGLAADDVARMRREMENAPRDYKVIESTHGDNVLHLTVALGYLKSLLANHRVARYIAHHHAEIGAEFQKLIDSPDLSATGG